MNSLIATDHLALRNAADRTLNSKANVLLAGLAFLFAMPEVQGSPPAPSGQLNYILQCQGCHRSNGEGIEGSVPDLRLYGRKFLATPEGRRYFVAVPGSANAPLSDQELTDVLNFIVSDILKNSDDASGSLACFEEEEVARYRTSKIPDVERLRAELVALFAAAPGSPE